MPIREVQTKDPLSTNTADEISWLEITAETEQSKGTGFMLRLKRTNNILRKTVYDER